MENGAAGLISTQGKRPNALWDVLIILIYGDRAIFLLFFFQQDTESKKK